MDLVNFRVGEKYIALNILDILVTERYQQDLTTIPTQDLSFLGVKDYVGTPTPVFDLGLIMNNQVTEEVNIRLLELLGKGEREHDEWLIALEHSLLNNTPFVLEKSSQKCGFGIWYDNFNTDDEDLASLLKRFDDPHKRLHELADTLVNLKNSGQLDVALKMLEKEKSVTYTPLKRLFEDARTQITESYKPIIVYTTVDGRTPYIGLLVDSVEDSVNIMDSEIKSLSKIMETGFKLNAQTQKMLNGIVKINDKYSLIIDSTAIFKHEDTVMQTT
ncbi:MAG: chemotaxis signal transduction protein [Alteromonadaceae bacterium]|jgi:chemotaxis signal transduction protein